MPAEIPVVTVIITCYNLGRYLQQAVSSVKRQSMSRWRLIVVDDGSTDEETLEALKVLEGEGPELLRLGRPQGVDPPATDGPDRHPRPAYPPSGGNWGPGGPKTNAAENAKP